MIPLSLHKSAGINRPYQYDPIVQYIAFRSESNGHSLACVYLSVTLIFRVPKSIGSKEHHGIQPNLRLVLDYCPVYCVAYCNCLRSYLGRDTAV